MSVIVKVTKNRLTKSQLSQSSAVLNDGGVVAFPTDTVYGLGCNAFNIEAIKKIYQLKGRHYNKPLPILLASQTQVELVAINIPEKAYVLMEAFWPGPLTLVLSTAPMALFATRGKKTIAVRVPKHPVVHQLLSTMHAPLASTSANRSGHKSLNKGSEIKKNFNNLVDMIIDGGKCHWKKESSVVDVTHYPFTVLREGVITKNDLLKTLNLI